ncbi:MAG: rhomboid family intramembrane serine protease [Chthoniobacterales bacterium]
MFYCPHCKESLQRHTLVQGAQWRCPSCEGRAVSLAVARRMVAPDAVNRLWQAARSIEQPSAGACECPLCRNTLREVAVIGEIPEESVHIDVCTSCHSLWFDTHEVSQLTKMAPPKKEKGKSEPQLSPRAREIVALAQVEALREREDYDSINTNEPPDNYLNILLTFFGIPVEENAPALYRWPFVTWGIGLVMLLVFLALTFLPTDFLPALTEDTFKNWGFIPDEALRHGGLTLITSFFLHAGWFHLLSNLAFLLIFGDNVESYLGHFRFLLLVFTASFFGDLLHMTFEPQQSIPAIGASGGISGILAFYALQFPKARLVYMIRIYFYVSWLRFPAYVGFALWIILQLWALFAQLDGKSSVSVLAHLGGVCIGILWFFLSRKQEEALKT